MEKEMLKREINKKKKEIKCCNKRIKEDKEKIQKLIRKIRKLELQILKLNIIYLATHNKKTKQNLISAKDLKNESLYCIQSKKAEIIQLEYKRIDLFDKQSTLDNKMCLMIKTKIR